MTFIKGGYVYIMTNQPHGVLYIGVTSQLPGRVNQHKSKLIEGFTKRYKLHRLVWFERHDEIESAILREKQMKKWRRDWKVRVIEETNPKWRDLYDEIL
jgi:putative endonuclease